ncbi:hypothetical protein [Streptomyces sp. x-80]|uniref:hypothetical protein n=1 Tax=Streptomyces sp. x-80 TaxID=2789282 RepID=UPI0039804593
MDRFDGPRILRVGRPAGAGGRPGVRWGFGLGDATPTPVPESGLAALLPGERTAALPAFVGHLVVVRALALIRDLLRRNGFPSRAFPACRLPPAACRLPPAACRLPPAACRLPPAACRLPPGDVFALSGAALGTAAVSHEAGPEATGTGA